MFSRYRKDAPARPAANPAAAQQAAAPAAAQPAAPRPAEARPQATMQRKPMTQVARAQPEVAAAELEDDASVTGAAAWAEYVSGSRNLAN